MTASGNDWRPSFVRGFFGFAGWPRGPARLFGVYLILDAASSHLAYSSAMGKVERQKRRSEKRLKRFAKYLEPGEKVIRGFPGVIPSGTGSHLNIGPRSGPGLGDGRVYLLLTDRAVVILNCWQLTVIPNGLCVRLPRETRLGPVDRRHVWAKLPGIKERGIWVSREFFDDVDRHDKSITTAPEHP